MNICLVSNGNLSQLSQSQALAESLIARARQKSPTEQHCIHIVELGSLSWLSKWNYKGEASMPEHIHLVLCAGPGTQLAALSLARKRHCPCIVCTRPNLPRRLFSLCLIPEHHRKETEGEHPKVIYTKGALSHASHAKDENKTNILFLIGGENKEYDWDGEGIVNQITHIARFSASPMHLTTSRRTDKGFVDDIALSCPNLIIAPFDETEPSWIHDQLPYAKEVWVTIDSRKMIYEALSSGVPVGVLGMPRKASRRDKDSRIVKNIEQLMEEGLITSFAKWANNHRLEPLVHLDELSRCCDAIEQQFPQLFT